MKLWHCMVLLTIPLPSFLQAQKFRGTTRHPHGAVAHWRFASTALRAVLSQRPTGPNRPSVKPATPRIASLPEPVFYVVFALLFCHTPHTTTAFPCTQLSPFPSSPHPLLPPPSAPPLPSGYSISSEALSAVMRAHDGRGRPTMLTSAILSHLGLSSVDDLIG